MLNFYENGSDYTQTTRSFCPNVEIFKKILNKWRRSVEWGIGLNNE